MAARKCIHCNYRILQPEKDLMCPNCGKPHSGPAASTSMPLPPPAGYTPAPSSLPVPLPVPGPAPLPTGYTGVPTPIVPVPSPVSPTTPAVSSPTTGMFAPDLEGMIASQPDIHQELLRRHWANTALGCIFYPLLFILRPIQFIFSALGRHGRQDRYTSVTTARVRRADGKQYDIRFEGDLVRSRIALGDNVSLWGHERNGILIVKKGYNHTTGGEIRVRAPHLPWLSIIVLVILVALVSMACFRL